MKTKKTRLLNMVNKMTKEQLRTFIDLKLNEFNDKDLRMIVIELAKDDPIDFGWKVAKIQNE